MAEIDDIRHFSGDSGMNLDDDEKILKENEFRIIRNARTSEGENSSSLQNIPGNTIIQNFNHPTYTLPSGVNRVIGYAVDNENNTIYYFLRNSSSLHCILRYNISENTIDHIVYSKSILGFDNLITHANVLGGMLFWVDGSSPKMLDIEKAYNHTHGLGSNIFDKYLSITEQILNVIKYPPITPPEGEFVNDFNYEQNNIRGKLFQFKYRYTYDNNEESVFSPISDLIKPDFETFISGDYFENQNFNNRIDVSFNTGSYEVYKIDIAAREGNSGHWRLVKTFYKYNDVGFYNKDDNDDTLSSNANRLYWFYNNVIGTVLDQKDANRDQDYVPLVSNCQDIIERNRLVYADNTEGFDNVDIDVKLLPDTKLVSPDSDIELGLVVISFDPGPSKWRHLEITVPETIYINRVYSLTIGFTYTSITNLSGLYTFYYQATDNDNRISIANEFLTLLNAAVGVYAGLTFATLDANGAIGPSDGMFYIIAYNVPYSWTSTDPEKNKFKVLATQLAYETHKSGSWHEYGLRYFDKAGRGGSVNTSTDCNIYIPFYTRDNAYIRINKVNRIEWTINHNPPSWASYYQWCYTKNTSMVWSKAFHLNNDDFDGSNPTYWKVSINKLLNITIDKYPLVKRDVYNDWEQGDKIRFIAQYSIDGYYWKPYKELIEFEILNGELDTVATPNVYNINISRLNLSLIADDPDYFGVIVEIYRPSKKLPDSENDKVFYEVGKRYIIEDGVHDVVNGTVANGHDLKGDAYLRNIFDAQGTFVFDSFSFSDYYESKYTNIGRPAIVDKNAKRQRYKSDLRYSGLYIQNSQINELTKFLANDFEELSEKWGAITKIKEIGYSLKVLQEHKVNSIFIGREGLKQANYEGANIIVGISEVLANFSPSEDRWGCQNPESVFVDGKRMYFADKHNGVIIRNASNGNYPISEYKVKKYIRDTLDNTNFSYRIYGYYDGMHDEVGFTFSTNLLLHAGSLIFKEGETPKWKTFMDYANSGSYSPDYFAFTGKTLISWLRGHLYLHNSNQTRGEFYGEKHDLSVEVISNKNPISTKVFNSIGYISNTKWTNDGNVCEISIKPSSNYPVGMYSILKNEQFKEHEDEYWAAFLKDLYTNSDINNPTETFSDLFNGRELRGKSIKIKMVSDSSEEVVLFSVTIKSTASR